MSDEAPNEAEAPITGQGRMDVAWGSDSGDEVDVAQTSAQTAHGGEIFEQKYTTWN